MEPGFKKRPKDDAPGFKKRPKIADTSPGFKKRPKPATTPPEPTKPPEILWSPEFLATDETGIRFRIGFQWRGTGCRADGVGILYQTWSGERWTTFSIGVVPRCALRWLFKEFGTIEEFDGPPHEIRPFRLNDAVEVLHHVKLEAAEVELRLKEENHVLHQETRPEEVVSEGRGAPLRRPKKRPRPK